MVEGDQVVNYRLGHGVDVYINQPLAASSDVFEHNFASLKVICGLVNEEEEDDNELQYEI